MSPDKKILSFSAFVLSCILLIAITGCGNNENSNTNVRGGTLASASPSPAPTHSGCISISFGVQSSPDLNVD
jgi:hypothetical protein